MTGDTQNQFEGWLDQLASGKVKTQELWDDREFLGHAWEFTRVLHAKVADQPIAWKERVQLLRSPALTQRKQNNLEARLRRAEQAVRAVTPPVGPGKKQCREEPALRAAVSAILERCDVTGLLTVSWQRQEDQETKYVGPGRGSAQRASARRCASAIKSRRCVGKRQPLRHGGSDWAGVFR